MIMRDHARAGMIMPSGLGMMRLRLSFLFSVSDVNVRFPNSSHRWKMHPPGKRCTLGSTLQMTRLKPVWRVNIHVPGDRGSPTPSSGLSAPSLPYLPSTQPSSATNKIFSLPQQPPPSNPPIFGSSRVIPTTTGTPVFGLTASNPFARSTGPSLPPPAAAFRTVTQSRPIGAYHDPVSAVGSVQEQRRASVTRMHQTQGTSPRSRRPGSRSAAAAGPSNLPQTSNFPQTTMVLASVPLEELPGQVVYYFCLLPFLLGHHESLAGSFQAYQLNTHEQMRTILTTVNNHNLSLAISIPTSMSGSVCKHHIALTASPTSGRETSDTAPWDVISPKSKIATHNRKFSSAGLYERDFTHTQLQKHTLRHPDFEHIKVVFIAITAPRHQNIWAPIDTFNNEQHACFPWRVAAAAELLSSISSVACIEGCPGYEPLEIDFAHLDSFKRGPTRSPPSSPERGLAQDLKRPKLFDSGAFNVELTGEDDTFPSSFNVFQSMQQAASRDVIDLSEDDSDGRHRGDNNVLSKTLARQLVQELIAAEGVTPVETLSFNKVVLWRSRVADALRGTNSAVPLNIRGPSPGAIVNCLSSLFRSLHDKTAILDTEPGILVDNIMRLRIPGIIHVEREFRIYSDTELPEASGAVGEGPENAVYIEALKSRLSDTSRWTQNGTYFRASFHSMKRARRSDVISEFRVDGTWVVLFILQLDREWLGEVTLSYIHAVDPGSAVILAPWFAVKHDTVLKMPHDAQGPVVALLEHYLPSVALSDFLTVRDPGIHREMKITLLGNFFFGCDDIWQHIEFIEGFARGFNLTGTGEDTDVLQHCKKITTMQALVAALYKPRPVETPDQVLQILEFVFPPTEKREESPIELLRWKIFQLLLVRWMRGVGYPPSLLGNYVSRKEYRKQRTNPVLRAESFLYSMTGVKSLPMDPSLHLHLVYLAESRSDKNFPSRDPPSLHFHDCLDSLDIPMTAYIQNLLLEEVDYDNSMAASAFDRWLSSEVAVATLGTVTDYNTV
ncbi:hypothetical protein GGX14DRAFT_405473 [Mycena pura]|uniref:Uncharacterized protein n=1 Tax=Mycena pura TaxID=153505 RepID=A0AAD6UVM4_9AGAR|nr:hypothetical protein GGX14DRAFT_405473 [Mycena pura]